MDAAQLSLNSATVPSLDLDGLIEIACANSIPGVGLWRDIYAAEGVVRAAQRIAASGLQVTSVCRGGMFPHRTESERVEIRDDNRRAVDEAAELGADCLVVVCGAAPGRDLGRAREQVADGLGALSEHAAASGVMLAVEPMHPMMIADRSVVTSLGEALDIVETISHPNMGIALDSYHVFWDIRYPELLSRSTARIHSVQISDWVVPIHNQLRGRGMPGQGSIDLRTFLELSRAAGYRGLVEVEVLSDAWASVPAQAAVNAMIDGIAGL
ncbi:sugar phosphate isomerase/epimerase [Mycobacterium sp. 21AC1]|uniref:sugar phosphate isomerase/epimerase family protein n=1 Tax=[Mycobacterium] appelbergii TaxID=2939269 RepID=UPI002938FA00|nr:sugar phosphate isomerase/epimerase family protein [Mycobacterium sp. 21AC1]MDV3124122.1 sugar phosphate isomerase/epimerase [Mycobacterium sp. 21AC1]